MIETVPTGPPLIAALSFWVHHRPAWLTGATSIVWDLGLYEHSNNMGSSEAVDMLCN